MDSRHAEKEETKRRKASRGRTAKRRPYPSGKRERKRAEIIGIAIDAMNRHGLQGLVLSEIAAGAGMTKENLTYYFKRKEDLAALCIDQTLDEFRKLLAAAAKRPTASERLLALYEMFFERAARSAGGQVPPLVMLNVIRALDPPYGPVAVGRYREILLAAAALFDAPDSQGQNSLSRMARAQLALSHLFWTPAWIGQRDAGSYQRLAQRLHDVVTRGLCALQPGARPAVEPVTVQEPAVEADGEMQAFYSSATRLINTLGYRGASVDRIGATIQATKGFIYHHHPSKEQVVLSCSRRSFAAMWSIIKSGEESSAQPWSQLTAVIGALIGFQASEAGPFLGAAAVSTLPEAAREEVRTEWNRVVNHLSDLLADAVVSGAIRPLDAAVGAQAIISNISATDELLRFLDDEPSVTRQVRSSDIVSLCVTTTLFGLLSPDPVFPPR